MPKAISDAATTANRIEPVNGLLPKPVRVQWVEEDVPPWVHLVRQPESWRKQLYIRGRRLTARHIVGAMSEPGRSADEVARDYEIPLGAVLESMAYCELEKELINREIDEENRGVDFTRRVKT